MPYPPLIKDKEALTRSLETYKIYFQNGWNTMMAQKLGLTRFETATDKGLISELLTILSMVETDMTLFFRQLAKIDTSEDFSITPPYECLLSTRTTHQKYMDRP